MRSGRSEDGREEKKAVSSWDWVIPVALRVTSVGISVTVGAEGVYFPVM